MTPDSIRLALEDYDPAWSDRFSLPGAADGRAVLEDHGIDPEQAGEYEGAARGVVSAIDAAQTGDARTAAQASLAATSALVCAATGPGAPVCLGAALFAMAAMPLVEALSDLLKRRILPPSTVAAPVVTPGREPLSYAEQAAIITATERQRRNEQAALARLALAYAAAYRNANGETPDEDTILQALSEALGGSGYAWELIEPLPSYKAADDRAWAEAQRAAGYSEAWIAQSLNQIAQECQLPDRVIYCAPGNTLWRTIPLDTLDGRPRLNAVADELRARAEALPRALVAAAARLAAQAAEDARAAWDREHPGVTPEQYTEFMRSAGDHAAQVAAEAAAAAGPAYLESYAQTHGGMLPSEFEAAVAAGEVDRAAYERPDGRPLEIGAGGGLDASGDSSGAGTAWVGGLLLGGFAILFAVARKGRG